MATLTMSQKIERVIRHYGKMTMTEIVNELNVEYKTEYARHVSDMANRGELGREWNEYGDAIYSLVPKPPTEREYQQAQRFTDEFEAEAQERAARCDW